ncbi:hypothetical protein [Kamptonema formosum]|nr:hypothetical protein [Oscillatoria sp. PCC 10802]
MSTDLRLPRRNKNPRGWSWEPAVWGALAGGTPLLGGTGKNGTLPAEVR